MINDPFDNIKPLNEEMEKFPPLTTSEDEEAIKKFYGSKPNIVNSNSVEDSAWIQTYSGRKIYPFNPNMNAIVIDDIAHSLSHQCRFTGHVKDFYSIAQHSVLVSYLCDQKDQMHGLLHDASEYLLVDIPSPLKRTKEFSTYREIEKKVQNTIYRRFNMEEMEPFSVKKADLALLATEARDLLSPVHSELKFSSKPLPFKIEPMGPKEAETLFLERFYELYRKNL